MGECEQRQQALQDFYTRAKGDALVVGKWFAMQASASHPSTLQMVKQLLQHPDFDLKQPNKVRFLIGAFCRNLPLFHSADGSGYEFLGDCICQLATVNAQIAAGLTRRFGSWRQFDVKRQELMKAQLTRIKQLPGLPNDVYEIAT